jgi:DNA-binding NarL/FixJ family response regulator
MRITRSKRTAYVVGYKLPDGSGLDVAERIRSKGREAPIILISGYDASTIASRAEKFHIFDFLEKPFSREIICSAVKKAIWLCERIDGIIAARLAGLSGGVQNAPSLDSGFCRQGVCHHDLTGNVID